MLFDDIIWHDGQIQNILIIRNEQDGSSYKVQIEADVYQSSEMIEKIHVLINFSEVKGIVTACNIVELEDYFDSGNIANGYKKGDMNYILYFCDGYVEITAGKIEITVL